VSRLSGTRRRFGLARDRDDGTVSVELALALPSVVVVLGLVMAGGVWLRADITATHAASSAARIALTQGEAAGTAAAERMTGGTAYVSDGGGGGWITARVVVPVGGPMPDVEATARVPGQG
jgi:Flp pilus assembly protein TadG